MTIPAPEVAKLTGLSISGASSVESGRSASYTCTATYSDGAKAVVTPTWSLSSGASYGSISAAGVFTAKATTTTRSVTIKAVLEGKSTTKTVTITATPPQTVTFRGNEGTPETQTVTYAIGGTYGTLPTATRAGYEFGGWWTAASGGARVTESSTVTTSTTRTLYAHWTAGKQAVIFNANGGSCSTSSKSYTVGKTYGTLPTATRTGYAFDGWWTGSEWESYAFVSGETAVEDGEYLVTGTDDTAMMSGLTGGYHARKAVTVSAGVLSPGAGETITDGEIWAIESHGEGEESFYTIRRKSTGKYVTCVGKKNNNLSSVVPATPVQDAAKWTLDMTTGGVVSAASQAQAGRHLQYGSASSELRFSSYDGGQKDLHLYRARASAPATGGGTRVTEDSTVTADATRTLYAHWTPVTQKLAFDANGGTCSVTSKNYTVGAPYGSLPTPSRDGHAFLGWFTAAGGGSQVVAGDVVPSMPARTLHAHWTDKQVTTFSGNGGSPAAQTVTNTIRAKYGELPVARRTGYALIGWFTAAEGGSRVTANTTVTAVAARTLYAHWTDQQETTFRGNGGTPATQVVTNTVGTKYGELPAVARANHVFLGWYDASEGGTRVTANTTVTQVSKRTLYARWTNQQVTSFRVNDGTTNAVVRTNTMGQAYGTMPEPKRDGRAFVGWFTTSTGGDPVTEKDKTTVATKRTLYAHWTDKQVTTFSGNGGSPAAQTVTNTIRAKYGELPVARRTGYALIGWFTAAEGGSRVTANTTVTAVAARTLYAHWTDQQETTFRGNGGTPATQVVTNTVGTKYGELPAVARANHVFLGWYDASEGGTRVTANTTVTQVSKRTLYARWTNQQVTSFRVNDGTTNAVVRTNTMGQAYGTMPEPKRDGRAFVGWFTTSTGGDPVTEKDKTTVATKRTLYAHWTDKQAVTFQANGGTCDTPAKVVAIGGKYGALPTPTWMGHKFLGWFTAEEEGSRVTANTTVWTVAEKTLWAHWSETTRGLAISGFAVKKAGPAAARGDRSDPAVATLSFEAEAGRVYELQWTPALGGEWTTVRRWTAEADGETSMEVPASLGESTGFYRLATSIAAEE